MSSVFCQGNTILEDKATTKTNQLEDLRRGTHPKDIKSNRYDD